MRTQGRWTQETNTEIVMKSILKLASIYFAAAAPALAIGPETLDFDSLAAGTVVSSPGVFADLTFSSTIGNTLQVTATYPGPVFSVPNSVSRRIGIDPMGGQYRADFTIPQVRNVSVTLGDFDADEDPIYLRAFNSSGGALASAYGLCPASLYGGINLSVGTSTDIAYVLFWGAGSYPNTVYFDNFTYTTIPEPAISALAGLGAAALMIFRRRS
jgi:hypothetical protein